MHSWSERFIIWFYGCHCHFLWGHLFVWFVAHLRWILFSSKEPFWPLLRSVSCTTRYLMRDELQDHQPPVPASEGSRGICAAGTPHEPHVSCLGWMKLNHLIFSQEDAPRTRNQTAEEDAVDEDFFQKKELPRIQRFPHLTPFHQQLRLFQVFASLNIKAFSIEKQISTFILINENT